MSLPDTSGRDGPGCEHSAALSTPVSGVALKDISMLCGNYYRALRRARPGGDAPAWRDPLGDS